MRYRITVLLPVLFFGFRGKKGEIWDIIIADKKTCRQKSQKKIQ